MADQDFVIVLLIFKMAEPTWPLKFEESLDITESWYTEVFEVYDQDFAIGLLKFKMVNPIWW